MSFTLEKLLPFALYIYNMNTDSAVSNNYNFSKNKNNFFIFIFGEARALLSFDERTG